MISRHPLEYSFKVFINMRASNFDHACKISGAFDKTYSIAGHKIVRCDHPLWVKNTSPVPLSCRLTITLARSKPKPNVIRPMNK